MSLVVLVQEGRSTGQTAKASEEKQDTRRPAHKLDKVKGRPLKRHVPLSLFPCCKRMKGDKRKRPEGFTLTSDTGRGQGPAKPENEAGRRQGWHPRRTQTDPTKTRPDHRRRDQGQRSEETRNSSIPRLSTIVCVCERERQQDG